MADRTDFFTGQLVTQQDMDISFDGIEQAIWDAAADMGLYGIITGFATTESTPNALTVQVASGKAYSGEGKRLRVTELDTTVDISVDRDANDTTPLTGGNKRYVSVIITPDRVLDDVRPDINQFPVYYRRYEIAKLEVIMGSEAVSPTPPEVPTESVLVCDILLDFGQTTVANGDISFDRCAYMFSYEHQTVVQKYASISLALQSIVDIITNNTPDWSTIVATYGGSATWANGAAWLPTTTTLDDAVETRIVSALGATTSTSGGHLLGVYQSTYQSAAIPTLASGPLFARLESMRDATNVYMPVLPSWPDGDNTSNPADSVLDAVTKIVNNIAARASATDQGIRRMGVHGTSFSLASWQALGATTVYGVFAGLNSATGTDGAAYVGAKASGALLAGTVRTQLDALDTRVTSNTTAISNINNIFYQHPTPSVDLAPTYTNNTATYSQIASLLFGSPVAEQVQVGDVVEIRFLCTATAATVYGLIGLYTQEPSDGSPVEISGARVRVAVGSNNNVCLVATHTVTEAGNLLVYARGRAFDGTGTLTVVESYRLEATRFRTAS